MGEFDFINGIKSAFANIGDRSIEGIGDDCAIIPIGDNESIVVTSDMLIEDVHFLRNRCTPEELGYKSLAVNLSDVAAMGIQPIATLLSISLPKECSEQWALRFMEGYRKLSAQYNVALIGGDTTSSKSGIAINVTAIGRGPNQNIKRRNAAQVGDVIAVSGPLGGSAQGLMDIISGNDTSLAAKIHKHPSPRIEIGVWLGQRPEVHAMMDLSDGLASDLCHILRASNIDASIETTHIPAPYGIEMAVCGGEDYELLMSIDATAFESLKQELFCDLGIELCAVGHAHPCTQEAPQIHWFENGEKINPNWHGFTHF